MGAKAQEDSVEGNECQGPGTGATLWEGAALEPPNEVLRGFPGGAAPSFPARFQDATPPRDASKLYFPPDLGFDTGNSLDQKYVSPRTDSPLTFHKQLRYEPFTTLL